MSEHSITLISCSVINLVYFLSVEQSELANNLLPVYGAHMTSTCGKVSGVYKVKVHTYGQFLCCNTRAILTLNNDSVAVQRSYTPPVLRVQSVYGMLHIEERAVLFYSARYDCNSNN